MLSPVFVAQLPSTEEILPYLKEIQDNKRYSNFGPMVSRLHSELADYFAVDPQQVTTLSNATLALEGAIQTSSTSESRWLSPSWTFVATNLALERCRVEYSFGDIDSNWRLESKDTTCSILDVCPFGDTIDFGRLPNSKQPLLIDAAASFPALKGIGESLSSQSRPVGIVVSFHPTKIVPGIEGGVFISNKDEWVKQVQSWSMFGMTQRSRMSETIGTNAKMNEYQAAVALASIKGFRSLKSQWIEKHQVALEISHDLNLKVQPSMRTGQLSTYWIVAAESEVIESIIMEAKDLGIETRHWWEKGCHRMPVFEHVQRHSLTQTDLVASTTIGLPFHINMTSRDFEIIYEMISRVRFV